MSITFDGITPESLSHLLPPPAPNPERPHRRQRRTPPYPGLLRRPLNGRWSVSTGPFAFSYDLFAFNQQCDLERALLRKGNVHTAEEGRSVLEPVIERYREWLIDKFFRGDAGFAAPEMHWRTRFAIGTGDRRWLSRIDPTNSPTPHGYRLQLILSSGWERANSFLVFVAPTPIIARFKRLYDWMFGFVKMRRCMFAWGTVATSYVTTSSAYA